MSWLHRIGLERRQRTATLPPEAADAAAEHLLAMDEALEAILDLPGLEDFPRTKTLPAGFLALWQRALQAFDRYLEVTSTHGDDGRGLDVQCTPGCHGCCHDVPSGVQPIELLAIYATYREFSDFREVHNGAYDRADALMQCIEVMSGSRTYTRARRAYRRQHRPCVFLDSSSGRCRIYAMRPLPCRMHFSLSDPQLCWPRHPRHRKAKTINLMPPRPVVDLMRAIAERMGIAHLSSSLFQGMVQVGGEFMQTERLTERPPRRRAPRRKPRNR